MTKPLLDIQACLQAHMAVAEASLSLIKPLETIAEKVTQRLLAGGKILFCGNGGSAADAQHFAAELIGRFYRERRAIPALSLTTDSSVLTCLGNDYGFSDIFSRQLEALCTNKDVVVLISTSGKSENILKAAQVARALGAYTIGFTGQVGGALKSQVEDCLCVPSEDTPRIQEMHHFLGHTLCEWIELAFERL